MFPIALVELGGRLQPGESGWYEARPGAPKNKIFVMSRRMDKIDNCSPKRKESERYRE